MQSQFLRAVGPHLGRVRFLAPRLQRRPSIRRRFTVESGTGGKRAVGSVGRPRKTPTRSPQDDAAREIDRIAGHGIAAGRGRFLVAAADRLGQVGMQAGDLGEVAEAVAVDVEEAA